MTLLADRVQKLFFHDGIMSSERNTARLQERCAEVERAFIAESARWGYRTPESWEAAKDSYIERILPVRTAEVIDQYQRAGLYPELEAPFFSRRGGRIAPGSRITVLARGGTVYYTADGPDPRLPGGVTHEAAQVGANTEATVFVPVGAEARLLVPENGAVDGTWTDPDFDDSAWDSGATGLGFASGSPVLDLIATDLRDALFEVSATLYARIPFEVDDPQRFRFLELRVQYDDGFVAYLNGTQVASGNAPAALAWDSAATGARGNGQAVTPEEVDLTDRLDLLRPGKNVLALHVMNRRAISPDMLMVPELRGVELFNPGIPLTRTSVVRARTREDDQWSAIDEVIFVVDTSALRITEMMYHPPEPPADSPYDAEDFEYVELRNIWPRPLSLTRARFISGIEFEFPEMPRENDLRSGEIVLLVKNLDAFASRYDTAGLRIVGEYDGELSNRGERITLVDALGEPILDFVYTDAWHPASDGDGYSLDVLDPTGPRDTWGLAESWAASSVVLGTPGVDGPLSGGRQLPGDINQDGGIDLSDALGIVGHLFTGSPDVLPCGEGTLGNSGNALLLDATGDARVNISDAIWLLGYLFRGGPPPLLGEDCLPIIGCPDSCTE